MKVDGENEELGIIKRRSIEELIKELHFLDDTILPKLQDFKNFDPDKINAVSENMSSAVTKVLSAKRTLESFHDLLSEEFEMRSKNLTELEDRYISVMNETKGGFEEMIRGFLENRLSNISLNTGDIQEIVNDKLSEISENFNFSEIEEIKKRMEKELNSMQQRAKELLDTLTKTKEESAEIALKKADNIFENMKVKIDLIKDLVTGFDYATNEVVKTLKTQSTALAESTIKMIEVREASNELIENLIKEYEVRDKAFEKRFKKIESVTTQKLDRLRVFMFGTLCFFAGIIVLGAILIFIPDEMLFTIIEAIELSNTEQGRT